MFKKRSQKSIAEMWRPGVQVACLGISRTRGHLGQMEQTRSWTVIVGWEAKSGPEWLLRN